MKNTVSQFEGDQSKRRVEEFQAWFDEPSRALTNRPHEYSTPSYESETTASDMLDMFDLCVSAGNSDAGATPSIGLGNHQDDMEWRLAL